MDGLEICGYYVDGKLLSVIKSMYVDILACVRVRGGESEWFRIDSGVRQVYYVPLALQYIYVCSDEGSEDGDEKEGRE